MIFGPFYAYRLIHFTRLVLGR